VQVPTSQAEWAEIAKDFEKKWQFPNCIGAMDGKHIALKAPNNSGSSYNYKHFHSIILLAVVDAHYRIIMYDLGVNGRNSDAGVYSTSPISAMLQGTTHNIPPPQIPTNWHTPLPHIVVGDEAFPLKSYLMKPYPQRNLSAEERVFKYRFSHARRVAENAFGILVNRFAVLAKQMQISPDVVTVVTHACIALHNYLKTERDVRYAEAVNQDQQPEWHRDFGQQNGNRSATAAQGVRNQFRDYFTTEGAVPWQWEKC
jgi:hypothetical protein